MRTYTVGQLKNIIKESTDSKTEFKPVKYNDENKKINDSAYNEMEKTTKKFDGGLTKEKHFVLPKDDNKGMESLRIDNANSAYTKDNEARLKGFTSKQAEDIHKNEKLGNAQYGSDEVVKQFKDKADASVKGRRRATEIGLTGRELTKQEVDSQYNHSLFSEHKIKKLTFKNTVFLNENHMISRIPDIYMVEGNKFIMRDKNANEYIVEWHTDKPNVKRHFTQENILAEQNKMKHLFNYSSSDKYKTSTVANRLNENNEINDMLSKVRGLMK